LAWLENWIVKKVTVTRNLKIIEALGKAPKKPTIDKFDDIKDLENNTLDPAIEATASFITNQSGYNVLSKMKDAEGRYLLQPDVTQPGRYVIDGRQVVRVADRWLPDVSGSHPLYFGDLKQGITLFDRENMSLMSTNVGGKSFATDTTQLRVIDRFDVEVVDDGAWAAASFKTVANASAGTSDTGQTTSGK
jgi:HK97 family phage major capsid protein